MGDLVDMGRKTHLYASYLITPVDQRAAIGDMLATFVLANVSMLFFCRATRMKL